MIYEVLLDGKALYYPDDLECVILNAKLERALNDAGAFEFDVPAANLLYNDIENRRSMVRVLKDDKEIFCGEVRECEENIDLTKSVYAVGELAFLYDSIQPQGKHQNQTPLQFFTKLLQNHNSQVESKKQFQVGVVTVTDPNDSIYRFTNYEDTLTCMREKLCDSLGGYLRIRKENGVRYLDLVKLQDYGSTCRQAIEFGENLLKYACNASAADITTAVIPLGTRLDESPIEGLDAYTDIRSVNAGVDYVYLPEAVSRFGWIKRVVHWDDVTEPANLKKKAEEWLKENQYELLTLEINAVDLSMLDSDMDAFDMGDSVNALAAPYGMDAWFPVQKMSTYLQDPSRNTLVLSNTLKKSYSQQMASLTSQLDEKIPKQSSILEMAKNNASNLIKMATTGFIILNMDSDGNPKELLIMDTKDIATAKKVWRWNINGLGYSNTGYNGDYGLAMTMDGRIVADFITAGTMYADRIRGGTLTLGGYANDNGVLKVRGADGTVHTTIDESGINTDAINITGGTFWVDTKNSNENLIRLNSEYNGIELMAGMGAYGFVSGFGDYSSTHMWHGLEIPGGGYLNYKNGKAMVGAEEGYISSLVSQSVSASSAHIGSLSLDSEPTIGSDRRLKSSIEELNREAAAAFIYSLKPKVYALKDDPAGELHHGLIVDEVLADLKIDNWGLFSGIQRSESKYLGIRYGELVTDLIATVQHQAAQIGEMQRQLEQMKGRAKDE